MFVCLFACMLSEWARNKDWKSDTYINQIINFVLIKTNNCVLWLSMSLYTSIKTFAERKTRILCCCMVYYDTVLSFAHSETCVNVQRTKKFIWLFGVWFDENFTDTLRVCGSTFNPQTFGKFILNKFVCVCASAGKVV